MVRLLQTMAGAVERRPKVTLLGLLVATLVLGGLSTQQSTDTELTAFAPDSDLAAAFDRVQEDFAAGGARIQVVVDAGQDGDVLSPTGTEAAERVEDAVRSSGVDLAAQGAITSFASAPEPAMLLSRDLDQAAGTARAGLVVVQLDPSLSEVEAQDQQLQLGEALERVSVDGVSVDAFSNAILSDALQQESEEEMPQLLSLSLLLIIGILFLQFRKFSDVLLGFTGLIVTIVWMFGLAVVFGPEGLGVVGPFTQISTIVPVLLIGLGIDYAIHLNSRYREEQRHGLAPPAAASMAVRTVGGALVLATLTTVVGFLTNLVSPLPPIADFGVFTALGVISAFVVMTLLVPAARRVLDDRPRALEKARRRRQERGPEKVSGLASLMGRTAAVAERAPKTALTVALLVTVVAAGAGSRIETSFSQDDFVPEDSEPGKLLDTLENQFGGDLTESTYVLVDGDLTDVDVADAVAEAPAALADVDHVRSAGGTAEVTSPVTLLQSMAERSDEFAAAAARLGLEPDGTVAPDADLGALYDLARRAAPGRMARFLDADADTAVLVVATTAGQEDAVALAEEMEAALGALRDAGASTTVVSEPLVLDETLDALTASQTQGIVITLLGALVLLVAYFGIVERKPVLGAITMIPSIAVVGWVLGTMVLLDISFNVLTAMVASLAIGIGVPFGIHVTHRFMEDRRRYDTIDEAVRQTVTHTGSAMAGSAATTAAGFGVLVFASLAPMQQFGTIVAVTIVYSLLAAVLVQPSCLKLWGQWRLRRGEQATLHDHEQREVLEPVG